MFLDYFFLPAIFLIGIVTSYQDVKYGKIKNKWIVPGLVWGLGIYSALYSWIFLGKYLIFLPEASSHISYTYLNHALINALISFAVGYASWYFDMWSAGDAKLFFLFCFLLPLTHYSRSYLAIYPSLALILNIFIPVLIYLLLHNLYLFFGDLSKKEPSFQNLSFLLRKLRTYLANNYLSLLKSFITFALMMVAIQVIHQIVTGSASQYRWWYSGIILLPFIASRFLRRALKDNFVFGLFLSIFIIFLATNNLSVAIRILIMIKGSFVFFVLFPLATLIFSYSERKGQQQKISFAFWIFIGTIITIIIHGSLFSLFKFN
jgi:hypothetical protein